MSELWVVSEDGFDPAAQHHKETVFTIGNGYLCSRGAFEEGYPDDHRATFIHGVFDEAPIVFTELANAPDWLPLEVLLNGERFSMYSGAVLSYSRSLDLRVGLLTRTVRWRSSAGAAATLFFERFTSLDNEHQLFVRCRIRPEFDGTVEIRAGLHGAPDNLGRAHWHWRDQGRSGQAAYLVNQTRASGISLAAAMRLVDASGTHVDADFWDARNSPTLAMRFEARSGQEIAVEKRVAVATSRDSASVLKEALLALSQAPDWPQAIAAQSAAWQAEWDRTDVIIEGDDEAQLSLRFNLFQMLIAAPRHDDRVNIGAKTLSGFGYAGHAFWDTEVFMLPLFIYTAPHIARNLLNYRFIHLPGARAKAQANGFEGAQFPWESAADGTEVTPTWVPHFADRTRLVRIWTGDIEIHISADIAYAACLYWKVSGDDAWFAEKGAELVLDTAKFFAARAEWRPEHQRYEYNDVIGPDEYHDHVNNNAFTNRMAQWTIQTGLSVLAWLEARSPAAATALRGRLDLSEARLARWRHVIERIHLNMGDDGLIEQFDGYFQRRDVDLAALEPRDISAQALFGIEGCNETQILKQPDVLMMQYLLRDDYTDATVRRNYAYYTPRTDHTHGSSLGPSIQAIVACDVGDIDQAYQQFIRAVRADLRDVRHNAGDGIHAASAAGTWLAAVFGFGGLRVGGDAWTAQARLPRHWRRLSFKFFLRGALQTVDLRQEARS